MALLRNHNGYMQATGLKIVRGVEKSFMHMFHSG